MIAINKTTFSEENKVCVPLFLLSTTEENIERMRTTSIKEEKKLEFNVILLKHIFVAIYTWEQNPFLRSMYVL